VAWAEAYLCTMWHLDASSRLATIHGRKLGFPTFGEGDLCCHLTQCRLGRRVPAYQVRSRSSQPFGHSRHGPKLGACLFGGRAAGSLSNTMWPGLRPTSMPSFILMHPTILPQHTNATDRTRQRDRQTDRTTVRWHTANRFKNGRPKTERAKYWYWFSNTKKVLVSVLQSFFNICIGIGIGNTFCRVYWYWYCQYF